MARRGWLSGLVRFISLAVFFWAILTASAALGQITPASGPEIQVAGTAAFQSAPAVAPDGTGGVIAVWQKLTPGGWSIFARRYTSDRTGSLVPHPEFQVNTSTAGCLQLPAVASDAAGRFIVVWQSDQDPGGGSGIFSRRFDSTASPLDPADVQVNTTGAGNQSRPAVAMAPDGRFLIVWQSDSQSGGQGWDVVARAYTGTGSPAGGEILVNAVTAGAQQGPRAAYVAAPAQGFAVVWEGAGRIFARRLTLSGTAIDPGDTQVSATTAGTQRNPALASDPSGNYAVAWESVDADGLASRILARRFQGVSPLNNMADLTLDASPGATQQHNPAVAADPVGSWVVSWDGAGEDGSGAGIVAVQLDNRQTSTGPKAVLDNSLTAGGQTLPALAMSQGGDLFAVWQSVTPAVDGAVIQAKAVAVAGGELYTITPCRLIDTRAAPGPLGGPILSSGSTRVLPVQASACAIPATAKVLSVNVTAVNATGDGYISLFPGDAPFPGTASVNFSAASRSTIANNAHLVVARDGSGSITALAIVSGVPGQVHLVVDVNGYYQ
jgi:hypothetical protein